MGTKIIEKLVEPVKVETGSFFKIKIKAIRYATYEEIRNKNYHQMKLLTYGDLEGGSYEYKGTK